MTITNAMAGIDMPFCPPPYRGNKLPYATYQLIGQLGTIYAEGAEAETGVSFAVNIYADSRGTCIEAMRMVKAALAAGGWRAEVDTEYYETEVDRYHIVLTACTEGAEYG